MSLESATYIADLNTSNPVTSDVTSQGDDHLRLLKSVLQTTFPGASVAFPFPTTSAKSANFTVTSSQRNVTFVCTTTGADITGTLPTLASGDAGWECHFVKSSDDANGVKIAPASGNINCRNGALATVRAGVLKDRVTLLWDGSAWHCLKQGPNIGSVESYYGSSLPRGYLWAAGQTFTAVDYAELNAALGGNTLPDIRGRHEAGRDDMNSSAANRITAALSGITGTTLGAAGGAESFTIAQANLPNYTLPNTLGVTGSVTLNGVVYLDETVISLEPGSLSNFGRANNLTQMTASFSGSVTGSVTSGGSGTAKGYVTPTIICNKIVRAC